MMSSRVILVDEAIFIEDIPVLYKVLDDNIDLLNSLDKVIEKQEYLDAIKRLREVSYILKEMSEMEFKDAGMQTILSEN